MVEPTWDNSVERNAYLTRRIWLIGAIGIVLAGTVVYVWSEHTMTLVHVDGTEQRFWVQREGRYIAVFGLAVCVVMGIVIQNFKRTSKVAFERRIEKESVQQREKELAERAGEGSINFAALWAANQQRIDYYHNLALDQSKHSFRSGQVATFVGFGLIIALAVAAGFAKSTPAAIASGIIGLTGTALTAYIGSTFLRSQTQALDQIKLFFAEPVEFSRMLGIERIVETLPSEDRARAIQRMVDSTMPATAITPAAQRTPRDPVAAATSGDVGKKTLRQRLGATIAGPSSTPTKSSPPPQGAQAQG